jgi:hypothetical protein
MTVLYRLDGLVVERAERASGALHFDREGADQ